MKLNATNKNTLKAIVIVYYSDSRGGVCDGQKLVQQQAGYKMK